MSRRCRRGDLAHPTRFERVTFAFGGQRSIQLSYGCVGVDVADRVGGGNGLKCGREAADVLTDADFVCPAGTGPASLTAPEFNHKVRADNVARGRTGAATNPGRDRMRSALLSMLKACAVTAAAVVLAGPASAAEKKYDPGASDTEIKVGQTVPHSGPGSLYGVLGRVCEAYFRMLNEKGGINGRK